jgi:hypothetical protein
LENLLYHVLHDGRRVGPYDRRTIVGMRIKKTLDSKQVLVASDGARLTVAELVRQGQAQPEPAFVASVGSSTGGRSYSVVQGIHPARLLEVEGKGYELPPFKGELEVRVQTKVLRLSGRFRDGLEWREDRVKFPLHEIAHARLRGTIVDLWVRAPDHGGGLQRVSLDLLKPDAAGELAESLPHTAPWPGSEPLAGRASGATVKPARRPWLLALAATGVLLAVLLAWALLRR